MQPNIENEQLEWYSALLADPLYIGIFGCIIGIILAGLVVGLIMAWRTKNGQAELRAALASQSADGAQDLAQLTHKLELAGKKAGDMEAHLRRRNAHIGQLTGRLENTFGLQKGATGAGQQQSEADDLNANALLHEQDEVLVQIKERWLEAMRERTDHESQLHGLSDAMTQQQAAIDELKDTAATQQTNISELEKDLVEARKTSKTSKTSKTTIEKTVERAQRLQHEVKERIDEQLIPVRQQIQETREKVQQLPRQAKQNLDDRVLNPVKKQVADLRHQVNDLSAMVQELPHQAKVSLDERLVNPARAQVYQISNRLRKTPHDLKERLDERVIHPLQGHIHHATEAAQALPHQAKARFDEVAVPVTAQIERIKEIALQSGHAIDAFNNRLILPAMASLESLLALVRNLPAQSRVILKEKIIEPSAKQWSGVRQTLKHNTDRVRATVESGAAETLQKSKQQIKDFMSHKSAQTKVADE